MSKQKSTAKTRGKISAIKKTGEKPVGKAAKIAPVIKKKPVSTTKLLREFYPDLTDEQITLIKDLPYLDPGSTNYVGDLQEAAEAILNGDASTATTLTQATDLKSVYWTLPTRHKDELIFEFNISAEFESIRGQIMSEPCGKCGGKEFHCRNVGSSSDEIQKYARICVRCRE